jgi:hypothetical protein
VDFASSSFCLHEHRTASCQSISIQSSMHRDAMGERTSVVKVLCYNPEGRGSDPSSRTRP